MDEKQHFVRVDFARFKAFQSFSLYMRHFNILVGPNNAGKSTVIVAFRILAAAIRKARSRKPESLRGPDGNTFGYKIDLSGISVAEENIFFKNDDSETASVTFILSNKNKLTLYFPESEACFLIADSEKGVPRTPSAFKKQFNCPVGFVPILGPVDHREQLYREAAASLRC